MMAILEKLLPARFWKKPVALNPDQLWTAFASPENPQSTALLHVAQDKFVAHIQTAADAKMSSDERLRALDRAMAVADFMEEVDRNFAMAKDEVKRRESLKQEQQQKG